MQHRGADAVLVELAKQGKATASLLSGSPGSGALHDLLQEAFLARSARDLPAAATEAVARMLHEDPEEVLPEWGSTREDVLSKVAGLRDLPCGLAVALAESGNPEVLLFLALNRELPEEAALAVLRRTGHAGPGGRLLASLSTEECIRSALREPLEGVDPARCRSSWESLDSAALGRLTEEALTGPPSAAEALAHLAPLGDAAHLQGRVLLRAAEDPTAGTREPGELVVPETDASAARVLLACSTTSEAADGLRSLGTCAGRSLREEVHQLDGAGGDLLATLVSEHCAEVASALSHPGLARGTLRAAVLSEEVLTRGSRSYSALVEAAVEDEGLAGELARAVTGGVPMHERSTVTIANALVARHPTPHAAAALAACTSEYKMWRSVAGRTYAEAWEVVLEVDEEAARALPTQALGTLGSDAARRVGQWLASQVRAAEAEILVVLLPEHDGSLRELVEAVKALAGEGRNAAPAASAGGRRAVEH